MEKCQRILLATDRSKAKDFLARAQKMRYEDVITSVSRLSVFGRLYNEPARSFSYRSGDFYYLDFREEEDPTFGSLTVSRNGTVIWKMLYEINFDDDLTDEISLCLKQAKSLLDPNMPIFGPGCHQASNGFLYWSDYTGDLDDFEGFERIEDPSGECVFTIKSAGGYLNQ